jgi:hypothetical protein
MAKKTQKAAKPPVVTIVVWVFLIQIVSFVAVLALVVVGSGLTTGATFSSRVITAWIQERAWVDLLTLAVLSLLTFFSLITVVGLARVKPWAWMWAMTILGLRLLTGLVMYLRGDPYFASMILQVIAVFLLDQLPVRRAFGQEGARYVEA